MATIQRYQEKAMPNVSGAARVPGGLASVGKVDVNAYASENKQSAAAISEALQIQEQGQRSIEAVGAKHMSMGQAFDQVAKVGDNFFKLGMRLVDAQQETSQRQKKVAAAADIEGVLAKLQHDPDFVGKEDKYRQAMEEIRQKYSGGLVGAYAQEFDNDLMTMALSGQRQVRKQAWTQSVDARAATRMQLREAGMQAVMNDSSDRNQQAQTDSFVRALNQDVAAGVMNRKEATKEFMDWQHDLSVFNVKQLIEQQPMAAYGLLTQQQKFPKGSVREGETVPIPAGLKLSEVNELTKQAKAKAEDWVVDKAYQRLNEQFGAGNFNAKLKAAKSMEGLPFDSRRKLISALRTDQRMIDDADKKAKENAKDKGLTMFWAEYNSGNLKGATKIIDALERGGIVDADQAQTKRKMLLEDTHKTKQPVYTDTLLNLHNLSNSQILDLAGKGLSPKDAEHLVDKKAQWDKEKGPVNYLQKAAKDFGKVFKGKDYANEESDFLARLEDEMTAANLTPYSSKVADLAKGLMEKVDVPGWSDRPAYAEKTRRRRAGEPSVGVMMDVEGRPAFDPQLPGLAPKELRGVYEIMETRGVKQPTASDKQMALFEKQVGTKAYNATYQALARQGKAITPETMRKVWELYGDKLMEK
jgi:hypothetical protein